MNLVGGMIATTMMIAFVRWGIMAVDATIEGRYLASLALLTIIAPAMRSGCALQRRKSGKFVRLVTGNTSVANFQGAQMAIHMQKAWLN